MFCRDCEAHGYDRKETFIVGCSSFKLDNIKKHEMTKSHTKASEISSAIRAPEQTAGQDLKRQLTAAQTIKMVTMFRSAHAIAKNCRPFSDFSWQCELDRQKGIQIGTTYTNRKQCANFVGFIAEAERRRLQKLVAESSFLTIMSDGTTDSGVIEQEIIYVRFSHHGQPQTHFVGVAQVEKADAQHIFAGIRNVSDTVLQKEWSQKLVAFGSDGAAVMTGKKNGVVAKLKEWKGSYIVGIHCRAHRLELAFKDSTQKINLHKKLDALLLGLYYFYSKSSLNRGNLKRSYSLLNLSPLMPTRVGGTRWIGHLLRALDHFLRGYAAIVQHLQQVQSPDALGCRGTTQAKARNFYRAATSADVVQYACFLLDVLYNLNRLSTTLQKSTAITAEIHQALTTTKVVIEKYKDRDGSMLQRFHETEFEDFKLTRSGIGGFPGARERLLNGLLESFGERFEDMDDGVLHATAIADISKWPRKGCHEDFGEEALDTIADHFKPILQPRVEIGRLQEEWASLKAEVYSGQWDKKLATLDWAEVNRPFPKYKNILTLIDLVLSLPVSTAECERGFSWLKRTKTLNRLEELSQLQVTQQPYVLGS